MKIIVAAIILITSSSLVNAQNTELFKRKPWENEKIKGLLLHGQQKPHNPLSSSNEDSTKNISGVLMLPLKHEKVGTNENGDEIFAMKPDNMPCTVPGKNTRFGMPVGGFEKNNKNLLLSPQKGESDKDSR